MFHRPQTHCDLSAHSASVCQTLHNAGALATDAQLTWEGRICSMCLKRRSPNKNIAEWPFVDLQNEKTGLYETWNFHETHGYHANIRVRALRQSKVFGGQDTCHVFRIGLLTVLEPLLKNFPVVLRECRPVHDVSPLIINVSIETYKKIYMCVQVRYW